MTITPLNPREKELRSTFGERLVRLCDGRAGLRGGLAAEVIAAGDQDGRPVIDFIASSEALDRHGEIIMASGWRLDHYRRNPVFQNAHQYGDIIFTKAQTTYSPRTKTIVTCSC